MCGCTNLLDDSVGNGISYPSPVTMREYRKVYIHTMCMSNARRGIEYPRIVGVEGSCEPFYLVWVLEKWTQVRCKSSKALNH